MAKLGVLILAAGASQRTAPFDKLAQDYKGKPLLQQVCENYIDANIGDVFVVLGGTHGSTREAIIDNLPLEIIKCPNSEKGMGASISYGVAILKQDYDAIMIALADMPKISPLLIKNLAHAHQGSSITLPMHKKTYGHPVIFDKAFFEKLITLKGDRGARDIIKTCETSVMTIPDFSGGTLYDIDEILAFYEKFE